MFYLFIFFFFFFFFARLTYFRQFGLIKDPQTNLIHFVIGSMMTKQKYSNLVLIYQKDNIFLNQFILMYVSSKREWERESPVPKSTYSGSYIAVL